MSEAGALQGKVAVVTGGSSGIGAETVKLLAKAGARVVITYNNGEARAVKLRDSLPGSGHSIVRLVLNDPASARALADKVKSEYGRCDILVNSAGFTKPVAHNNLEALDEALFDEVLIGNVRGPYSVIRALVPLLKASGDGVVVSVSSVSAFTGSGSSIAYCAAKAALDTMTMSLARAFGPEIRFLCVSPASVATDFVAGRDRAALEKRAQSVPLKRVVEPQDVALAVMGCITHMKTATGSRFVIDAGHHL
ncbi:SDR family NAD(P)-dependent oxidoreductase [Leptospira sp. severe_002]|uniref:SDR family NAD(P)-dependent oxidoreductase n=1 Tax=Leptospira sp. severe_002 TaxID=2838237 RepID=UPI001E4912DE|nr:SDR family oxidoreductase [Leptospira sp. severe_002]